MARLMHNGDNATETTAMNGYISIVTGGFVLDPQGNMCLGGVWICWIDDDYRMHTACVHTLGM